MIIYDQFIGHIVIHCHKLAYVVDILNAIQGIRLIALRGHYTIDVITSILIALVVDPRIEKLINDEDAKNASRASNGNDR